MEKAAGRWKMRGSPGVTQGALSHSDQTAPLLPCPPPTWATGSVGMEQPGADLSSACCTLLLVEEGRWWVGSGVGGLSKLEALGTGEGESDKGWLGRGGQ